MKSFRSILLAGAAIAVIVGPAVATPLILAQATTTAPLPEAVLAAQAKVDAARGALRDAMAKGGNAAQARQALAAALKELDAARAAAGLPPSGESVDVGSQPPAGQPPAGQATGQPPAKGDQPPAGQAVIPPKGPAGQPPAGQAIIPPQGVPPPGSQPPAGQAVIPPAGKPVLPPAGQVITPPAGQAVIPPQGGQPPAGQAVIPPAGKPVLPPAGQVITPPAGQAVIPPQGGQPPAGQAVIPPAGKSVLPPAGQVITPPAGQAVIPPQGGQPPASQGGTPPPAGQAVIPPQGGVPPAGQAVVPPAGKGIQAPAGQAVIPPPGAQPPVGQAVIPPPPPIGLAPPAGQPPVAGQAAVPPVFVPGQKFDPSRFGQNRPRFGENQPADKVVVLPPTESAIKEGQQVQAPDGRVIVKEGGQVVIQHDDAQRFRRQGFQVESRPGPDGTITTTINGPGGSQIVTIKDGEGNILQRYRKNQNGSIEVLIGAVQAPPQGGFRAPPPPPKLPPPQVTFDFSKQLPPIVVRIPRQDYIVESSRASEIQLQQTFAAPPVEQVERAYSLEEIRRSARLRDKVRRVDFDTVTFEFGSAVLPDDQIAQMQSVGDAIRNVLTSDPSQVFLIEGHTDSVGSDIANLALSDRRAETVAELLTYYFGIPAENMVTQGYGEQYLKVPTTAPERQNRRVAFRNITPLMRIGAK